MIDFIVNVVLYGFPGLAIGFVWGHEHYRELGDPPIKRKRRKIEKDLDTRWDSLKHRLK